MIDRRAVGEYLSITCKSTLTLSLFEVTDIEDIFPVERVSRLLNEKAKLK